LGGCGDISDTSGSFIGLTGKGSSCILDLSAGVADGLGLGIGDWGLGIGPKPQSPIPNPHFI